jgi:predicted ArsR family transcriptional regulator
MAGPLGGQMDRAVAALQDLTRRDILYRFYANPAPRTVVEVARSAGIHRSVAFDHLERLVALGYLETQRRRGFPGKPANLYRLAQGPITVSHPPRQFGLLAQHLAVAMEEFGPAGLAAARRAGARLASTLMPIENTDLASPLQPLEALGGQYDPSRPGEIASRNCLFREACNASAAVCEFHAGLLESLLESGSPGVRVDSLGQEGAAGCRYRVIAAGQAREAAEGRQAS